jgi:hypothetical protein
LADNSAVFRSASPKNRKKYIIGLTTLLLAGAGAAFAGSTLSGSSSVALAPPGFSKSVELGDYGLDYATTGASQVRGDSGGSSGSDCSAVNTAASSASVTVPADATMVKAYLYWVGLEQHGGRGYNAVQTLDSDVNMTTASGSSTTVAADKRMVATGSFNGGPVQYAAYQADVTSLIGTSMSGTYTVAISGGIPGLCAYQGENVRAWQLVMVYDTPALDYSKVYIYDGLDYLVHTTANIGISGYLAPAGRTSTLTAFVGQGDDNLSGEYANTSDTSFPDFGANFADESVNGSASTANGQAIDIDTLTGELTPLSTSMNIEMGTTQDVILPVTFVLKMASFPDGVLPTTVPTTAAVSPTTVAAPTTEATTTTSTLPFYPPT